MSGMESPDALRDALRENSDLRASRSYWVEARSEAISRDLAAALARVAEYADALRALCEAVGDFHTSMTCTDSELVVPDMLAAMYEEQQRARALLAEHERNVAGR